MSVAATCGMGRVAGRMQVVVVVVVVVIWEEASSELWSTYGMCM